MSKRNRRRAAKKTSHTRFGKQRAETQQAEALTVFWMMALLSTVLGELGALAARGFIALVRPLPALVLLSNLLLLIAAVTGLLCLGLTPLVLRLRRVAPPPAITRFAIAAGLLPLATLAVMLLLGE